MAQGPEERVMTPYLIAKGCTRSEAVVAEYCFSGMSNQEIANELSCSEKTVKFHLTKVFVKFGVSSRHQLMAKFMRLIPVPELLQRDSIIHS